MVLSINLALLSCVLIFMGREVVVAITDGKLDFGTWERIFYGEFDGKRKKRVLIKIIGEQHGQKHN